MNDNRLRHIILFLLMAVFITPVRAGGLILRDGVPYIWRFDGGYVDLNANGNGQPLYTDIKKIDLSNIRSLGDKYVGQEKTYNLLLSSNSLNDGLVYGTITLKRYPDDSVRAYADKYDFDMKSWYNPLNWRRNVETIIGGHVAGKGKPFLIFIYGSQKLKPMYP